MGDYRGSIVVYGAQHHGQRQCCSNGGCGGSIGVCGGLWGTIGILWVSMGVLWGSMEFSTTDSCNAAVMGAVGVL